MKTLRFQFRSLLLAFLSLLPVPALAQKKQAKADAKVPLPAVEVYEIAKEGSSIWPQGDVILKVWNPTGRTIYFPGVGGLFPAYDVEVKRGEKWLIVREPNEPAPDVEVFSLRPGSGVMVTMSASWAEKARRFRFYFYTKEDGKTARIYSVRSRAIDVKELGEKRDTGSYDVLDDIPEIEPRAPFTDAEVNKRRAEKKVEKAKAEDEAGEEKEVDPSVGE